MNKWAVAKATAHSLSDSVWIGVEDISPLALAFTSLR